jgi:hypothetical protein
VAGFAAVTALTLHILFAVTFPVVHVAVFPAEQFGVCKQQIKEGMHKIHKYESLKKCLCVLVDAHRSIPPSPGANVIVIVNANDIWGNN